MDQLYLGLLTFMAVVDFGDCLLEYGKTQDQDMVERGKRRPAQLLNVAHFCFQWEVIILLPGRC